MSRAGPGASPRRERRSPPPQRAGGRPPLVAAAAAVLGALRDPVIVIFLLAGTFDVLSGDRVVDGLALFGVAVGLGWDERPRALADATAPAGMEERAQPTPRPADHGRVSRVLGSLRPSRAVVIGGLLYAALVATFARYSWPATVAVEAPAVTAVALVWRRPLAGQPAPRRLDRAGAAAWGAVLVALGLWELSALLLQPSLTTDSYEHPTLSVLMDPLLAGHLGRSVFLWLWLTSGWYLLGLVPAANRTGEAR
ncbi:MAG TPA: hypothetical protein VF486_09685 [Actinomycetes bacterium]